MRIRTIISLFALIFCSADGQETKGVSIQATLAELQEKKTSTEAKVELVKELGKLGPDAAPAVPFFLSNGFFYEQGGRTAKDSDRYLR